MDNTKKSKVLNIVIIILALALIAFVIAGNAGKKDKTDDTNKPDDSSLNGNGNTLTPEEMGNAVVAALS